MQITSLLSLITTICAALFSVICATVCYRLASEFSSLTKLWKASAESAADLNSRLDRLEQLQGRLSKKVHLDLRRDPETGRSARIEAPQNETKEATRRRLGLIGSNAAKVAHDIHSRGGLQ